jgi:hypothetical protein
MDRITADWDRLRHPSANLHVLVPTPEKLVDISARLLTYPMFLADEYRNPAWVDLLVASMFGGPQFNWIYEIGDWRGILAFQDIWPGYKAEASFLLWDNCFLPGAKKERIGLRGSLCWGADFIRELRDVADLVMGEFKLKRLGLSSPEQTTVDIAKLLGFKVEGRQRWGFRFEGDLYTQNIMRKIKE